MLKITRPQEKILLAILLKRTVSFFCGLCILTIFLYGIGTYQGFMDNTQVMLLNGGLVLGLILGLSAIYGFILETWFIFRRGRRYVRGAGAYIILGICGILIAALAAFIIAFTKGNIP